jgi:TetR/AcrR family transcriptional repressor of nem operon
MIRKPATLAWRNLSRAISPLNTAMIGQAGAASRRSPGMRHAEIKKFKRFALRIEEQLNIFASYFAKGDSKKQDSAFFARERAIQVMSELVGAVIPARAVAHANPSLSDEILEVSRRNILGKGATRTRSRRPR